jgi:hypothetical protein
MQAVAYCRTCGKPVCAACTREVQGVIYCEQCLAERMGHPVAPAAAFADSPTGPVLAGGGPHPAVAGILAGFFPFGVGAVYTGQYAKGLAHLLTFTFLVWGENVMHNDGLSAVLGLGLAFFYVYQIIDAVRSAHAIRLGVPPPDPFGLSQAFGMGDVLGDKSASPSPAQPGLASETSNRSSVPTAAVILIGLGMLFLLHTTDLWYFNIDRLWPLILIGLGTWIFYRKNYGAIGAGYGGRVRHRRGLMAPTLLIVVGVLSLIESYNGPGWERTWPVILLAIGLAKLLDHKIWPTESFPPPPAPGAFSPPPPPPPVEVPPSSNEVNHG